MKSSFRTAISFASGFSIAALLPIYPWRSELRSYMTGSGGDRISHEWSLRGLWELPRLARYGLEPLVVAIDVALLVLLGVALSLGFRALLAARRS